MKLRVLVCRDGYQHEYDYENAGSPSVGNGGVLMINVWIKGNYDTTLQCVAMFKNWDRWYEVSTCPPSPQS